MILTNIKYKKVIKKYNGDKRKSTEGYTTPVSTEDRSEIFMLDSNKNREKWKVCMLDAKFNFLSNHTTVHCWWDRHKIDTSPLGCPVSYHNENSPYYSIFCSKLECNNIAIKSNVIYDFFVTEGIFCSFCCILAYIDDEVKKGNVVYSDYISLVYLLFKKLKGLSVKIPCAGSWKILRDYGGDTSIDYYRKKLADFFYEETGSYKRPYMITTPFYIKESTPKYLN